MRRPKPPTRTVARTTRATATQDAVWSGALTVRGGLHQPGEVAFVAFGPADVPPGGEGQRRIGGEAEHAPDQGGAVQRGEEQRQGARDEGEHGEDGESGAQLAAHQRAYVGAAEGGLLVDLRLRAIAGQRAHPARLTRDHFPPGGWLCGHGLGV
ncbi:hypothetical protein ID875_26770 [Streptomyces globisporus]|uniref:Uncharacterized protein n=1 Tax=Streptomyces globisporus TaxID=1908 RepID=A0A927BP44_STRGL|nr:hypothetical protein [Streptomyces globisporus]